MTVDPRFLTWDRWSSETKAAHLVQENLPDHVPEENWRYWAAIAVSSPTQGAVLAPQPQFFERWQDWAFRFNESLALSGG